jgi:hypothetical protein
VKISVTITVDIPNPEGWAKSYGCGESQAEILADVKSYIGNAIQQAPPFSNGEVTGDIYWR